MLSADNSISNSIKKDNCLDLEYMHELGIPFHSNSELKLFLIFCLLLFKQIGSTGPFPIFKITYFFLLYSHLPQNTIITVINPTTIIIIINNKNNIS